jgi:hypothetical protein
MHPFTPNPPPPLPSPPLWEWLILENPWPTAGVLAILAVAVLGLLNRFEGGRTVAGVPLRTILAALLILTGSVILAVGMAITTDRQVLLAGSERLVNAAAARDLDVLDQLLASDARLHTTVQGVGMPGPIVERDEIFTLVEEFIGRRYPLQEHRVMEVQATLDGERVGRAQVRVRVVPERTRFPHTSWWRIDWRREDDGRWRVRAIEPLDIPGARLR